MLVSLFIKERLYIGEATVATICGVIFGPHAANLLDPRSWGNVDQITLECSRIVLVVQCFAVGVELPKAYMNRHWRSVVLLLLPVMIYGWLVTSVFIWWMVPPLNWLESLCCAACVTATDPVLASSVVGKGKFAKRVPKHLRDLLSAESGCNDGMAFPFIYLSIYLIKYRPNTGEVIEHWVTLTILYECIFGAIYGVAIGYAARHAIKWAERHNMVDRESFLVFYFVLALFCAGSGSILGLDDLLVGFAAGVGFSNDGWFQEKTEESHVSNVIDLLLNLAYFVYFGSIIPWEQFRSPDPNMGLTPWRLVVLAILVILFRRIPIMVALKPIIADIKTWRESLFAGHFGPIGVGAIFVAILARAELQTDSTTPLAQLPPPGSKNYMLIALIWPITTFLVISSILVHGSSIAVFTLGKRINTLTITMSYTQANEDGPSWMNRLPRIQSQSRGSFSARQQEGDSETPDEKLYPPGSLPFALPGNFLRRQREEEENSRQESRASSLRPPAMRKKRDLEMGPGGPISQSAITPQRRTDSGDQAELSPTRATADKIVEKAKDNGVEAYQEGNKVVVEDKEGEVLDVERAGPQRTMKEEGEHVLGEIKETAHHAMHPGEGDTSKEEEQPIPGESAEKMPIRPSPRQALKKRLSSGVWTRAKKEEGPPKPREMKRGPALAYQFGNTIIVEDEDGEVVKKFNIPKPQRTNTDMSVVAGPSTEPRQRLQRMGTWAKLSRRETNQAGESARPDDDDDRLRFVTGGRRMSKADFIQQIQRLDPKAQVELLEQNNAPPEVKQEAIAQLRGAIGIESDTESARPSVEKADDLQEPDRVARIVSRDTEIPTHPVGLDLARLPRGTAAQRRRERALSPDEDSDDDGTERVPPVRTRQADEEGSPGKRVATGQGETTAERRRREAALGMSSRANNGDRDSDENDEPQQPAGAVAEPARIRFADEPTARRSRVDRGGGGGGKK
ncbi:MAG: hypothetical protein M1823_004665 [Watsoniomyces obsoletus]|nr:MAG: hypothetical protein M1823_004665 [Watsoniomyces obsoletus]